MSVLPAEAAEGGRIRKDEETNHRNMQGYEEAGQGPQCRDPCGKASRQ
jgi:hypothetical protein